MAAPTLLDIAKLNNDDGLIPIIEETIVKVPELTVLPAIDIPGQSYNTLVRTALPSVGFRNANEGVAPTKSTWENRLAETKIVDASVEADKAVIDNHRRGVDDFFAKEAAGHMLAALKSLGSQLWYGTETAYGTSTALAPTKGFAGALAAYDSTGRMIDAGGTTAATGSSVWFVRKGEEFVRWIFGQDGKLDFDAPEKVRLTDGNGNPYTGWRMPLLAYIGVQFVAPKDALIRIRDITEDSGKKLTDALISQAWALTDAADPSEWELLMTKRSQSQLRDSRTATNPTGAPAPLPKESAEGIPINITNGLINTETLS